MKGVSRKGEPLNYSVIPLGAVWKPYQYRGDKTWAQDPCNRWAKDEDAKDA